MCMQGGGGGTWEGVVLFIIVLGASLVMMHVVSGDVWFWQATNDASDKHQCMWNKAG